MKITEYAVKNNQFTLVMVLMVLVLGVTTLLQMPRSEDPELDAPIFPVVVVYPGAGPQDLEDLVVDPIERKIYGLEDIKRIKTTILDGVAAFQVEYEYRVDPNDKYQELVREVSSMRDQLPAGIQRIEIQKASSSDVNILQIALISENAPRELLYSAAEDLQKSLETISGLKNVKIHGDRNRQVRIDLNLAKMANIHIPAMLVADALQKANTNIPAGSITEGQRTFNVKTNNNLRNIREIENIIVRSGGEETITIGDIAEVYYDYSPVSYITRMNGHRAVFVTAALKPGENISQIQKIYQNKLQEFEEILPGNIDLQVHFDQADNVNKRLKGLGLDFLIAISLVLITLLPLGPRASAVVMIAVPLSIGIGIILLNLLGYNLNQLSIVGFVIALGLLVDDSIVVVENIERWIREGHTRMQAVLKGTQQIGKAVLGCTATLVIAFMPLAFMPDAAGDYIRSLPVAVIGTILGSLLVALTIVPYLSGFFLKPKEKKEGNFFMYWMQKIIHLTYARLLDTALRHPLISLLIAALIFAGSLWMIPVVGLSLFPASEKPQFVINISTPDQSDIFYTNTITRSIEAELDLMPEVRSYTGNVGKGNPRVYYNVIQGNEQSNFAQIFVQLESDIRPDEKLEIIENLRNNWDTYPGAEIKVVNFEQGVPQLAPVEIRLKGDHLDTLSILAARTEAMLKSIPGTIYVSNPVKHNKTDIRVTIHKEKARNLAVSVPGITQTIRMALAGLPVGNYMDDEKGNKEFEIVLTVPGSGHPDLTAFDALYVNAEDGRAIPLDQLATIEFESSPPSIHHLDKIRTVYISSFVGEGYLTSDVLKETMKNLEEMDFPQGYSYEMGGEIEGRHEAFHGFESIILVTVFFFIAVLILQFKTFKSTLIVLSVIPLGIVGAVLALWVTGNTLSFVATVGIVALAGIEVKNTILQVDFTNQLREQGMGLLEAVEEAGEKRFIPIMLTTMTAIGGLLPIAWSSNPLISPLAIVIIGGLISSTLLSRIVTPVMYKLMPPAIEQKEKI